MHHHTTSLIDDAAGVTAVVLFAVLLATGCWRYRHLGPRLAKSAAAGLIAGAALIGYAQATSHKALAHSAKASHTSLAFMYASAFTAVFLLITVLGFAVATMITRRRRPFGIIPSYRHPRVPVGMEDRW
jgi:hypothetical protein